MMKIKIGISACLLGQNVRFDGGHKKDKFIMNVLGEFVDFVSCCPEVAIGMGVPRKTVHLEGNPDSPRVVGALDKTIDVTDKLINYSKTFSKKLPQLSGYILKSKSPTCGMARVKVYRGKLPPLSSGVGVFAKELMDKHPYLPVEEEGRLNDPALRENFMIRVYALARWYKSMEKGVTAKKLVSFHTKHKLLLMSHQPKLVSKLGKLISNLKNEDLDKIAIEYLIQFMRALNYKATPAKHVNAMQHALGYIKRQLTPKDKIELKSLLDRYRHNKLPLIVPMTMLKHHFEKFPHAYIANQIYFEPYPSTLKLRNSI